MKRPGNIALEIRMADQATMNIFQRKVDNERVYYETWY